MKASRSGSASKAPLGAASIDRLMTVACCFLRDHPRVPLRAKGKNSFPLDPTAADLASDASIIPDCIQAHTNGTPMRVHDPINQTFSIGFSYLCYR
jgi:hypothetical protein